MSRRTKYYYMMVSNDEYELPLCVAESSKELSEMAGVKHNSIIVALLRDSQKVPRKRKYKYVKVEALA